MKQYEVDNFEDSNKSQRTLLLSLMLILLSLFIFLTTFTESDRKKIEIFKRHYNKSLMFSGEGTVGKESVVDSNEGGDPLFSLLKRIKSENINRELMVKYLTLQEIKDLEVFEGISGVVLVLPQVVRFRKGRYELDYTAKKYLSKILFLVKDLPFEVELRGYSSREGFVDDQLKEEVEAVSDRVLLKDSARRAMVVYEYFIGNGVSPEKIFVSGYGDSISDDHAVKDKVEILFKELR